MPKLLRDVITPVNLLAKISDICNYVKSNFIWIASSLDFLVCSARFDLSAFIILNGSTDRASSFFDQPWQTLLALLVPCF
jgi:hypothetical protein